MTFVEMPLHEKIADLERRILALEQQARRTTTTTTRTTTTADVMDLEPEAGRLWASFDALMAKAFRWTR